jgi:hypothetical protein
VTPEKSSASKKQLGVHASTMLAVSGSEMARTTLESSPVPNFVSLPSLGMTVNKDRKYWKVVIMKNQWILLIALFVALAFLVGFSATRQRWEYQETCSETALNELGANGWELVSVTNQTNDAKCFYLKRAK